MYYKKSQRLTPNRVVNLFVPKPKIQELGKMQLNTFPVQRTAQNNNIQVKKMIMVVPYKTNRKCGGCGH